jgi:hypothetical protein
MIKNLALVFLALSLAACQQKEISKKQIEYVDLRGYFNAEANRLNAQKLTFTKTVCINRKKESKLLNKSIDWEKELSVFKEADINKPAFKGMYQISMLPNKTIYTTLSKNASVKRIEIDFGNTKKPVGIRIFQLTKNMIYQSTDTLSYYPDSIYSIHKKQEVRVLGTTVYTIEGKFN